MVCPVCKTKCKAPLTGHGLSELELSRWVDHNRRANNARIDAIYAELQRKRGLIPSADERRAELKRTLVDIARSAA